ncbi:polyprenyl synthetase family protein [Jiangella rhizosphaerae]|uniref:Polyprenyl synthetase family protein n=1 Tax=Jiangella rhizosphaerae TaxID=2293569 RepID=A0A418KSP5_9ACTN|nr:polyprenyl synthetase family protein [Jiangella rhizosphaerae]RIQ28147.1 polyprenyl synthetase family protein [Jiangella rhizosphaerae]
MDSTATLASPDDPVGHLRPRIQGALDAFLDAQRELLGAASEQTLPLVDAAAAFLSGGKRLRPTFCYWGWRAAGGDPADDALVTIGAALELFQASALVHDDLIDASDTRRGLPSVHRRFAALHRDSGWQGDPDAFGAAAAILLGDMLLAWSAEVFDHAAVDGDRLRAARTVFDRMRTEVGGGQYLDMLEQVSGGSLPGGQADRARTVIRYKSARYSVEHPLVIGGALAGAPEPLLASYRRFGTALGEAFQLRDDVLGVFGDPAQTGKPTGDDLREGKRTLLIAYALERASADEAALVGSLLGDPALDLDGVTALRRVLVGTGALARVEALVTDLVADARSTLDAADVTDDGRKALSQLIELTTERTH